MKHLLSYKLYEYTNYITTDNFKNWFKDSKVVDNSGKPLVVYHGTSDNFDYFDISKMGKNFDQSILGFYFTNGAEPNLSKGIPYGTTASEYALNSQKGGAAELDGANIIPVYLSIQNPLRIKADDWYSPATAIDKQRNQIKEWLKNTDYDGIISENEDKDQYGSEIIYVVFKANQIKSAIGNNGNFNPNLDSINEQKEIIDKENIVSLDNIENNIRSTDWNNNDCIKCDIIINNIKVGYLKYVYLNKHNNEAKLTFPWIDYIEIYEQYRKKGLSKLVFNFLDNKFKAEGYDRYGLRHINLSEFYDKLGFKSNGLFTVKYLY